MENRKKFVGILVMVILGLSLFAINANAQDANSLEGIWVHTSPYSENAKITFSGDTFVYTWDGGEKKGTFTVNRRNITFNADDRSSWRTTFRIQGNNDLLLEEGSGVFHLHGRFVKVDPELTAYRAITADPRATVLEGVYMHHRSREIEWITFSGNSFSYTWGGREKKGRFTLDGNNISLHADDGTSWITTYTFDGHDGDKWIVSATPINNNLFINLRPGSGCFHSHGVQQGGFVKYRSAQDANPFDGIWFIGTDRLAFSGNSFSYTFYNGSFIIGTYTVNGNNIAFISDRKRYDTTYSFTDEGFLTFERGEGSFWWYGTYSRVDPELRAYKAITPNTRATPLEGIWMHMNHWAGNARFVFSGNSFTLSSNSGERRGRFTLNGNQISMHTNDGCSWITTYSINNRLDVINLVLDSADLVSNTDTQNNSLVLEEGSGRFYWWWGNFAKVQTNSAIEGTWKRTSETIRPFDGNRPLPRDMDATITFSGNTFEYRHRGAARSGIFEIKDDRIILTSRNRVVREYYYSFYDNGSKLFLWGASGDEYEYYDGLFDKQ